MRIGSSCWPIAGLAFGTILGLVGAYAGLGALLLVLALGVIGSLAGRALEGSLDIASLAARRR